MINIRETGLREKLAALVAAKGDPEVALKARYSARRGEIKLNRRYYPVLTSAQSIRALMDMGMSHDSIDVALDTLECC